MKKALRLRSHNEYNNYRTSQGVFKKRGETKRIVKGGGCSGFTYEWGVTDAEPTVENLWLDPNAEMFVFGCTVDYIEELGGSYLKVINPNATAQCGCGESFGI